MYQEWNLALFVPFFSLLATIWFALWYWWRVDARKKVITIHTRCISKACDDIGIFSYSDCFCHQCRQWITFVQSGETLTNSWHTSTILPSAFSWFYSIYFEVSPEQVIMSHSPLKMYTEFHKKHCLISGQGPISSIAKNLGFTKVTTIEQLCDAFPNLDMVDHKKRRGFVRSILDGESGNWMVDCFSIHLFEIIFFRLKLLFCSVNLSDGKHVYN